MKRYNIPFLLASLFISVTAYREDALPGWQGEVYREYTSRLHASSAQKVKLPQSMLRGHSAGEVDKAATHKQDIGSHQHIVRGEDTGDDPSADQVPGSLRSEWVFVDPPKKASRSLPPQQEFIPTTEIKATFITLTRGDGEHIGKHLGALKRLLHNMDYALQNLPNYPLTVFYEDIPHAQQLLLQKETKRPLEFVEVQVGPEPDFLTLPRNSWPYPANAYFGVNYRHMCRFFAVQLFQQKVLEKYDYYARLDTDSHLLAPFVLDPFEYMVENNKTYAFDQLFMQEQRVFMDGLWSTVAKIMRTQNITAASTLQAFLTYNHQYNGLHFWDNFEISSTQLWRRPEVQNFLSAIDHSGGIYYHRWGDAELHTLAVAIFVPGEQLWWADVPYQHYNYYHCPEAPAGTSKECKKTAGKQIDHNGAEKPKGDVPMDPAELAHHSQHFFAIATGQWGWPAAPAVSVAPTPASVRVHKDKEDREDRTDPLEVDKMFAAMRKAPTFAGHHRPYQSNNNREDRLRRAV